MGQGVSVDSHQCSGVLRQLLKARGVSVAEKDLQGFLAAVPKYNPWFAEHSRLDLREWERVGETLKETRGRVHKNALAVWTQVTLALEPLWGDPAGPDEEQAVPGAPAAPSAPSAPAAPAAPAAPVETPLQRALREGAQDMDVEDMLAFLDAAWPAPGTAVDFRMIKALRESVAENGLRAPFTITLVEAVSRFPLPPNDWFQLARACLNFWDFAIWKSEYSDQAQGQASRNKRLGVNISLDMLTGSGPYLGLAAQASMPAQAYQQIGECARRAWSALPAQARAELPGSYAKCLQGPKEPFSDFVDRLARRLRRQVGNPSVEEFLLGHLAYENANGDCRRALGSLPDTRTLPEMIRACQDVGTTTHQAQVFAAALAGALRVCFQCGKSGHLQAQCRQPSKTAPGPRRPAPAAARKSPRQGGAGPALCPRCEKGNHWASQCRSRLHKDGRPLPERQVQGPQSPPTREPPRGVPASG
ncbi:endogenous retrovirus group K member 6 Gag polyprotein isoform X2 [Oryctolagus cuniculus]|nr:endogenous retrovirus group K member 8 Gag polyprotein isoform X1 [Oryctolagus cuniculus]